MLDDLYFPDQVENVSVGFESGVPVSVNDEPLTAFEVVRLAADLATAQQRYSDALVRTARAAAVLRQLTGGYEYALMELSGTTGTVDLSEVGGEPTIWLVVAAAVPGLSCKGLWPPERRTR